MSYLIKKQINTTIFILNVGSIIRGDERSCCSTYIRVSSYVPLVCLRNGLHYKTRVWSNNSRGNKTSQLKVSQFIPYGYKTDEVWMRRADVVKTIHPYTVKRHNQSTHTMDSCAMWLVLRYVFYEFINQKIC